MSLTFISDFAKVLFFPKDSSYHGGLGELYFKVVAEGLPFNEYFYLNEELLDFVAKLDGVDKVIFTNSHIDDSPEMVARLLQSFREIIQVSEFGAAKTQPQAYTQLIGRLGVKAEECLFIDDTPQNVLAAKMAGLQAVHFASNTQIIPEIEKWLKNSEK
jgi:HAD superfamily hydrolase (TIGR01509 family)